MHGHSTGQHNSERATKLLARMGANLREAVESLVSDPRFVSHDDHGILLFAIAETCDTREEALALFNGAVRCIEDGTIPVGHRARPEDPVATGAEPPSSSGTAMSDVLDLECVDSDWQYLWSHLGDRAFCKEHWNQYVAVFMQEVVGSGSTDPAAREAAKHTLRQRGRTDVPSERFVVDFVGDA
jgi:hypothetical protein